MRRVLLIASFILLSFVGLRWCSAHFFHPFLTSCNQVGSGISQPHISYGAENLLSDEHRLFISDHIAVSVKQQLSAHSLIANLKKQFPVIKKIVVSFQPLSTRIQIESYEPLCAINDSLALASNHELFSKAVFSSAALEQIPVVAVADNSVESAVSVLPDLFDSLPSDFSSVYSLELVSDHYVRLVDKNEPQFVIVSSVDQKDQSALLSKCDEIKKSLNARGAFDRGIKWIADARFAHYIVAYKA